VNIVQQIVGNKASGFSARPVFYRSTARPPGFFGCSQGFNSSERGWPSVVIKSPERTKDFPLDLRGCNARVGFNQVPGMATKNGRQAPEPVDRQLAPPEFEQADLLVGYSEPIGDIVER
jgi:hypothetical protein